MGSQAPAKTDELTYDWNEARRQGRVIPPQVEFYDETLRDGLQNPSVTDPKIEDKLRLLHLMDAIGIDEADIGLPGSSRRAFDDCLRMCREITSSGLSLRVSCAGRTVASDLEPMIELSQRAGIPIDVYVFVGSSPIRALAEDWDLERIKRFSADAIDLVVKEGLQVSYVTEDTTRSRPNVLAELFKLAIDHGASRLCLCDTVGHATPDGVRNLLQFTRSVIAATGAEIGVDWHGHNDRGLALVNALFALEWGADRVHGTALGIGERAGNAPMELIMLNLKLLGMLEGRDLTRLLEYCQAAAQALDWQVPINYPLVGHDAFRTATGVHAAAIIKAQAKGDAWLADRVYSGVPAGLFGRTQEICIGYMSGASNVTFWLKSRGIEPTAQLVSTILSHAKASDHILSDEEVFQVIHESAQSFAFKDRAGGK
jgi:2-isopropylmalate synthase